MLLLYGSSVRKDGWGNLQKSSSAVSCREECRGDDDTTMILTDALHKHREQPGFSFSTAFNKPQPHLVTRCCQIAVVTHLLTHRSPLHIIWFLALEVTADIGKVCLVVLQLLLKAQNHQDRKKERGAHRNIVAILHTEALKRRSFFWASAPAPKYQATSYKVSHVSPWITCSHKVTDTVDDPSHILHCARSLGIDSLQQTSSLPARQNRS